MPEEQERIITALKYAIEMEKDGRAFYLKSCAESSNELGRKLMESLAHQEDYHRQEFEQIYEGIRKAHAWPKVEFKTDGGRSLRTIFARQTEGGNVCAPGNDTELAVIEKARKMEGESYDYYHAQKERARTDGEREFYDMLAAEEWEHQLVLNDYYEYMKNPAGWFVKTERPSIDG
jgi:rubrerythrin